MFKMNKTNEYNYVPNQVNIRIWDIHFASYPTTSESVSVSELKYGKKCYPDPIPCVFNPIPSLGIVVQVWPGLWQAEGLTQSELPAMAPEPAARVVEQFFTRSKEHSSYNNTTWQPLCMASWDEMMANLACLVTHPSWALFAFHAYVCHAASLYMFISIKLMAA